MGRKPGLIKTVMYLWQSWWGRAVLAALGLFVLWIAVEFLVLSGEKTYSDYLHYNKPLLIEAREAGERYRVSISSSSNKAKRVLTYKVLGPGALAVIDSKDGYRKKSRSFYFTAEQPGNYYLTIDDYYRSGGEDAGAASMYVNSKWVRVYRGDRTWLLGKVGFLF
jgi:hypothetical protein